MSTETQAPFYVRITTNEPLWQHENRTIHVTGEVASALELLIAANGYGVHKSKIKPDVPARLDQLKIPYRFSSKRQRGTGYAEVWCYLNLPNWMRIEKVEPAEVAA